MKNTCLSIPNFCIFQLPRLCCYPESQEEVTVGTRESPRTLCSGASHQCFVTLVHASIQVKTLTPHTRSGLWEQDMDIQLNHPTSMIALLFLGYFTQLRPPVILSITCGCPREERWNPFGVLQSKAPSQKSAKIVSPGIF